MDWVDKSQNYKDLYGILLSLRGSHLNNFLQKTLKLGWVAFHSLTIQLKCLDIQSNHYTCKKLVPVLSRFCNWLYSVLQFCLNTITTLWAGSSIITLPWQFTFNYGDPHASFLKYSYIKAKSQIAAFEN